MRNVSFTTGLILTIIFSIGNMYYMDLGRLPGTLAAMLTSIIGIISSLILIVIHRNQTKATWTFGASLGVFLFTLLFADNYGIFRDESSRVIVPLNALLLIRLLTVLISLHRKRSVKTSIE